MIVYNIHLSVMNMIINSENIKNNTILQYTRKHSQINKTIYK